MAGILLLTGSRCDAGPPGTPHSRQEKAVNGGTVSGFLTSGRHAGGTDAATSNTSPAVVSSITSAQTFESALPYAVLDCPGGCAAATSFASAASLFASRAIIAAMSAGSL